MVGLRWVGCCALLLLSCGRTAKPGAATTDGGSLAAVRGTGSGGALASGGANASGSGPFSAEGGETGAPDCPVTPAAGKWVGLGPDPYGFELTSDGVHLSGQGCLGGLPEPAGGNPDWCSPLVLQADTGRRVSFFWDMKSVQDNVGFGYALKMELTLAPERNAMAGKVWTSLGGIDKEGQDMVLVRYPEPALPPATLCSSGVPSGACFLRPLRSDRTREHRVVQLGEGNLLLLWLNNRGTGDRLASARFDATAGEWQAGEFLDDGTEQVTNVLSAVSPDGRAVVVFKQNSVVVTRAYDSDAGAWSKQQLLATKDAPSALRQPKALFVYEGGSATLLASSDEVATGGTLSASDYDPASQTWGEPHTIGSTPNAVPEWAGTSDAAHNALVVWVRGAGSGQPSELWFSTRSADGAWADPAMFYSGDKGIAKPALASGKDGTVLVTWQEYTKRIASSSYSFESGVWSAPLDVLVSTSVDNRTLLFNDDGVAVAYFHRSDAIGGSAEQKCELHEGVWGTPQVVPGDDGYGASHWVNLSGENFEITVVHPRAGVDAPPLLVRPWCEGY